MKTKIIGSFKIFMEDNRKFLASLLTLQFVGLFGIFVKYMVQLRHNGYHVISRLMGLSSAHELPFLTRLSFFKEDILLNMVIIPLGVFLVFSFSKKNWHKRFFILLISLLLALIFYIDLYSLANVGKFMSFDMLTDAIKWGVANPESITEYLSASGLIKFLLIICTCISIIFIGNSKRYASIFSHLFLVIFFLCFLFSLAVYSLDIKPLQQHKSMLHANILALLTPEKLDSTMKKMDANKIQEYYFKFIGVNNSAIHDSYVRKRPLNSDIMLFVLETIPGRIFNFNEIPQELETLNRIADKSIISLKHFTTYPYTTDAIFSILSSCYPINIRKNYLQNIDGYKKFGLMSVLHEKGYTSAVYSPMIGHFADVPLYKLLGVKNIYLSPKSPHKPSAVEKSVQKLLKTLPVHPSTNIYDRLYYDLMAKKKMEADILSWKMSNKRFISLFIPQLSHGPWLDLYNQKEIHRKGRKLVLLQLKWIDDFITVLEQKQLLKNTIILITSDHGVRTKEEYPELPVGMTNRYSFNVPFLLYLPELFKSKKPLNHLTSHIDIMPTILDYLQIPRTSYYAQGISVLDNRARTIFFIADNYFGSDAYFSESDYYMYQSSTGLTLKSKSIDFDMKKSTLLQGNDMNMVKQKINTLYSISKQWAENNKIRRH